MELFKFEFKYILFKKLLREVIKLFIIYVWRLIGREI